jgi:hypothetical protein
MYEAEIANSLHTGVRHLVRALGGLSACAAAIAFAIGIMSLLGMPLFGYRMPGAATPSQMKIALARPAPVKSIVIQPAMEGKSHQPVPSRARRTPHVATTIAAAQPAPAPSAAATPRTAASVAPPAAAKMQPSVHKETPQKVIALAQEPPHETAPVKTALVSTVVSAPAPGRTEDDPALDALAAAIVDVSDVRMMPPASAARPTILALASPTAPVEPSDLALPLPRPSGPVADPIPPRLAIPLPIAAPPRPPLPPTPAQRLHLDTHQRARAEKCLAQAIYFEAGDQPYRGQLAVAQVVMNRVFSPYYPEDVCGVIYQRADHHLACQFTFACDGKPERVTDWNAWTRAKRIARDTLDGKIWVDEIGRSTHYHANYVHPMWVREMHRTFRFGEHIFYRPRKWGDGSHEAKWSLVAQHVVLPARRYR